MRTAGRPSSSTRAGASDGHVRPAARTPPRRRLSPCSSTSATADRWSRRGWSVRDHRHRRRQPDCRTTSSRIGKRGRASARRSEQTRWPTISPRMQRPREPLRIDIANLEERLAVLTRRVSDDGHGRGRQAARDVHPAPRRLLRSRPTRSMPARPRVACLVPPAGGAGRIAWVWPSGSPCAKTRSRPAWP